MLRKSKGVQVREERGAMHGTDVHGRVLYRRVRLYQLRMTNESQWAYLSLVILGLLCTAGGRG